VGVVGRDTTDAVMGDTTLRGVLVTVVAKAVAVAAAAEATELEASATLRRGGAAGTALLLT
jgi:dihydroxyacetone kinase